MKIIIVGCGRMGKSLIHTLSQEANQIVAIDSNPKVFETMPIYRNVTYKVGIGFDREVLESADINHADAVVSCTDSDETNALVARIARNLFSVPKVIARLYNNKNASIYTMLGIQTISTTEWGTRRVVKLLNASDLDSLVSIGNSDVEIIKIHIPPLLIGKNIQTLNSMGVRVISIMRDNHAFIPAQGTLIQRNDVVYVAVEHNDLHAFKNALGL